MANTAELNALIKEQGDRVRQLKLDQADKETIQPELDSLKQLKIQLATLKGEPLDDAKGKGKAKKAYVLKTPKVSFIFSFLSLLTPSFWGVLWISVSC